MKRGWLGIVICTAALLAVGCSLDADVPRTADEFGTDTAAGKAPEATADTAAAKSEAGGTTAEASAAEVDPAEKREAYVSSNQAQSVLDGSQEESEDYMVLGCAQDTIQDAAAYKEGHIKSTYHMGTDDIELGEYWNIQTPEEIKDLVVEYGIIKDIMAIRYSDKGTNSADDRAALTLSRAGVENIKCLDGGYEAWFKSGYGTEKTVNTPQPSSREFGADILVRPEYILSIGEIKDKLAGDDNFKLVSIRNRDEFLGGANGYGYIDRAGEPEGVAWGHDADDGSYRNEGGTTTDLNVLKGYLEESGVSLDNELSFHCGAGWRATIPSLIYYENGMTNMAVYDGGWYQWQMDDFLPIQVGDPAGSSCQFTTVDKLSTGKVEK